MTNLPSVSRHHADTLRNTEPILSQVTIVKPTLYCPLANPTGIIELIRFRVTVDKLAPITHLVN